MNLIRPRSNSTDNGSIVRTEHWDGSQDVLIRAPVGRALARPDAEPVYYVCPFCERSMERPFFAAHAVKCISDHLDHPDIVKYVEAGGKLPAKSLKGD